MSETNLIIEEVTDIDASWEELVPLWKGQGDYHQPLHGRALRQDWQKGLRERFAGNDDELVLIARIAGRPVGFLNAAVRRNSVWDYTHLYVDNVYVLNEQRGSGMGRSLLEYAEAWARARGIRHLQLIALSGNTDAIAVWRQLGFRDDHVGMEKTLDGAP